MRYARCLAALAIVGFGMILTGGSAYGAESLAMSQTVNPVHLLTEKENGKTFDARVGEVVEVQLPENPTTGFLWTVVERDDKLLKLISSDFVPQDKAEGRKMMVGSGGTRIFLFRCLAPGSAKLGLSYNRSWEKGEADRFAVTVNIR